MALDVERVILGCVLLDNSAYAEASARLGPYDFALTAHQRVFRRVGEMLAAGRVVDIVTLSDNLSRHKELESVGGVAWLASLTEGLPRRLSIDEYVTIVRDKALLRALILVHSEAITRAADQSEDAEAVLTSTRSRIEDLAAQRSESGLQLVRDFMGARKLTADELMDHPARQTGVPTGIEEFDRLTCGLQPAELIIIAARPSIGKSDMSDNIADHVAVNLQKTVAFYTPEMSTTSVINRLICSRARVDRGLFREGKLSSEDRRYFSDAREEVEAAPLYLNDSSNITLSRIRSETTHLKAKAGLRLVLIDYLQLMSAADMPKKYNREQEVAGISRGAKLLAKDLDVPVVVMAQISRDNTKRTDKRPILSDLRESGALEQDADVVAFLHREEYYDRDNEAVKGKGEIIVAKARNGPVGTVHASYNGKVGRWADKRALEEESSHRQESFKRW